MVVSTSPLSHGNIINLCLSAGMDVFSEINLVDSMYEENIKLSKEKNKVLFLSSTFLYRKEIQYIMDKIRNTESKLDYVYHVGQYLPDWHPWETYNDFFIGDKRTNGCREILAIELPWIVTTFGEVEDIKVLSGKDTSLKIDYKDNYMILLNHKSGHKGALVVDVVCRKPVRELEVFGENLHVNWGGDANSLRNYDIYEKVDKAVDLYDSVDRLDGYSSFVIENAYEEELKAFFKQIEQGIKPVYNFESDLSILKLIDKIEKGE